MKERRRARRAALEEEKDLEINLMSMASGILSHISSPHRRGAGWRHHGPPCSGTPSPSAARRSGCARRISGHLAQLDLEPVGESRARDRRRAGWPSVSSAGDTASDPGQHGRRMGAGRPGGAVLRRRGQRHLPDRCGIAGALPVGRLAHHASCSSRTTSSSTRRWRCASACRCCKKIVVFDMEGLRAAGRPGSAWPCAARTGPRQRATRRIRTSCGIAAGKPRTTWRSWSTPRAPPGPRARCTPHRAGATHARITTR